MTDERWTDIKAHILEQFEILRHVTEEFSEGSGTMEVIEFVSPAGKFRFERTDRPLVLGKKTIGSKRIGSETTVEYLYSETERVHKFRALQWDEGENIWSQLEIDKGLFSF